VVQCVIYNRLAGLDEGAMEEAIGQAADAQVYTVLC
jgi:hypothetical protein